MPGFVAPFAGAWIEILIFSPVLLYTVTVAPFAGAWIEISASSRITAQPSVAPFGGAWIEILIV